MARQLGGISRFFKIGSQLFTAEGPRAVDRIAGLGFETFLDLKFHDIPNTVAGSVAAAAELRSVAMLTIHTSGGLAMMKAAREAVSGRKRRPVLLGVTILTSLDSAALREIGIKGTTASRALALAKLAKRAGLDGVVASTFEAAAIRRMCGPNFLIVVPGVRPTHATVGDQARVATPTEAIRAGANYVVVGRPITTAQNPRLAAEAIAKEIESA